MQQLAMPDADAEQMRLAGSDPYDEFDVMYRTHAPAVQRFLLWRTQDEQLSQDLTSSVFEKAWRSRDKFYGGSAAAWLIRIARNVLIDYWRKRKEVSLDNDELPADDSGSTVAERLDQEMLVRRLKTALARLPEESRTILELRFIQGMSCRQAAESMCLSESNVRVLQYRALRKLRGYLE